MTVFIGNAELVEQSADGSEVVLARTAVPQRTTALVANPIKVDAESLPFVIADGLILDCADDAEIAEIQGHLERLCLGPAMLPMRAPYECEKLVETVEGGGVRTSYKPLEKSEWRYYVVRSDDAGTKNIDLSHVSSISQVYLDVSTLSFGPYMHGWTPHLLFNRYQRGELEELQIVNRRDLEEISELYRTKVSTIGVTGKVGAFEELQRALEMLGNLRTLSGNSSFRVLGLFGIIEMLITHNPHLEDRGDSITHQMKSKIPLLERRFDRELPYANFFGNVATGKVWSALYKYRSAIAHGGRADFSKDLRILVDSANADAFLRITVQSLLRHALKEPFLYRDLKEC